jgi:hypothetical protein
VAGAHLLLRALDGPPDAALRPAAAHMARPLRADRHVARVRVGDEPGMRGHAHPGDARAARRRLRSDEGRRQRRRMIGRAEALDREDLAPHHRRERGDAGAHHGAIDGDGAGPAWGEPAAERGGIEFELVAQHVKQGGVGGDIHHVGTPVDLERDGHGPLQVA